VDYGDSIRLILPKVLKDVAVPPPPPGSSGRGSSEAPARRARSSGLAGTSHTQSKKAGALAAARGMKSKPELPLVAGRGRGVKTKAGWGRARTVPPAMMRSRRARR
jgi:hypothetical protein